MAAKRFPIRWWLTTGSAALLVVLSVVGVYQNWQGLVMPLFVLGLCIILWVVERHNEREADVDQIWWIPSSVLWARPPRVVLTLALSLALFVIAGFVVFGGVGPWLLWLAVVGMVLYRVTLGRKWLKQDRAALSAVPEPEGYRG